MAKRGSQTGEQATTRTFYPRQASKFAWNDKEAVPNKIHQSTCEPRRKGNGRSGESSLASAVGGSATSDETILMDPKESTVLYDDGFTSIWNDSDESEFSRLGAEHNGRPARRSRKRTSNGEPKGDAPVGLSLADWDVIEDMNQSQVENPIHSRRPNGDVYVDERSGQQHASSSLVVMLEEEEEEEEEAAGAGSRLVNAVDTRLHHHPGAMTLLYATPAYGKAAADNMHCSNPACCNPHGRWLTRDNFSGTNTTSGQMRVFKTCGHCRQMDAEKKRKKRAKQEELHAVKDREILRLNQELAKLRTAHDQALALVVKLRYTVAGVTAERLAGSAART